MHTTYFIQSLNNLQCPEKFLLNYPQSQVEEGINIYLATRKIKSIIALTEAILLNILQILIVKIKEYLTDINNMNLAKLPTFQYRICDKGALTIKIFNHKDIIQKDIFSLSPQKHKIRFPKKPTTNV